MAWRSANGSPALGAACSLTLGELDSASFALALRRQDRSRLRRDENAAELLGASGWSAEEEENDGN
eukprot:212493-Pleurochrysis_carterae.AAC.2